MSSLAHTHQSLLFTLLWFKDVYVILHIALCCVILHVVLCCVILHVVLCCVILNVLLFRVILHVVLLCVFTGFDFLAGIYVEFHVVSFYKLALNYTQIRQQETD